MRASLLLQYALPHRALSRVVYRATRWTLRPWKNFLISTVVNKYQVDMSQALDSDPASYASFNAFFTRALKPAARQAPADAAAIACPADGTISQLGAICAGRIFQAKGFDFAAAELLGDADAASAYVDGRFATIYLSPRDYHRVHMPLAGTLKETVHIPGRLFSVAPFTTEAVPRLFARNERLVCHFEGRSEDGSAYPFCVVMVGAMLVSSVETVWNGLDIPPYANTVVRKDWRDRAVHLPRFAEMGRFNMGSTVILLLPPSARWDAALVATAKVQVGQTLGLR